MSKLAEIEAAAEQEESRKFNKLMTELLFKVKYRITRAEEDLEEDRQRLETIKQDIENLSYSQAVKKYGRM